MERVFLTGSAGFIGFHLAQDLLSRGYEVLGFDNFNDYYSVSLKRDRVGVLSQHERFQQIEGDLCDAELLRASFDAQKPDHVCHLAAQAGVRYSLENPSAYAQSNVVGFVNILELCRHFNIPRLVYASSSSVYGGNEKVPFSIEDPVNRPVSLYAATKRSNELMAHTYTHLFGLQTVGLRFFTVYGSWYRPDMALYLFAKAMAEGKAIKVFNHGDMLRDFTYIDDIVAGVRASLFAEGLADYELFNLGNHHCVKLGHMIDVLSDAMGIEPKKEMLPMQPGDVYQTYADIAHSQDKLGYCPATSIEQGIPEFVRWFKEYHNL